MSAPLARKLKQAQDRFQQGDIAGGQFLCEEILRQAPRNPDALWLLGMSRLMTGRIAEGAPLLEQVVALAPDHGAALENLGLARLLLGEYEPAERFLRRAARLPGAPATVSMRLGLALLRLDRPQEALAELARAAARDPRSADIQLNLGQAHARLGDRAAARTAFERALALAPQHADALFNIGVLCLDEDDLSAAQAWFQKALAAVPDHFEAHINLGIVQRRQGRVDDALATLGRALQLAPGSAVALDNYAQALAAAGRHGEARELFLAALAAEPQRLSAREGLATTCFALNRYGEALPHLREILRTEPGNRGAQQALANALFQCGELDEAHALAERSSVDDPDAVMPYSLLAQIHIVRGRPEEGVAVLQRGFERTASPGLLGMLTHQLRRLCDWERWGPAWTQMSAEVDRSADLGSPFNLLSEATTAQQQLDYTRRWAEARFAPYAGVQRPKQDRSQGRERLRVGYLSSDFHEHPAAYLLAEVFELHDRERFEIYAYSYGPDDGSAMRARLRAALEHFVDIAWEPDDIACERIRKDDLDILIDLHGYTVGDRLAIMARRPCAVQATWLGYPGTTGAPFIDYLIADPFVIPAGREAQYASERVVRLPHCYQPNDGKRACAAPLARSDYGLPEDAFVFCCFNQAFKITPEIYACWMRLLHEVPGSVLWLVDENAGATRNLKRYASEHGVPENRLAFAPRIPLARHLARYRVADLALDTFPYTSHTTASDALWAGCPLVGLCGDTFASRVSGSILTQAGLADFITDNLADYQRLARELATTPARMAEARARVAAARGHAPLFDTLRFTRDLEALYLQLAQAALHA